MLASLALLLIALTSAFWPLPAVETVWTLGVEARPSLLLSFWPAFFAV